jgi:spermidine/putrescine-binding protein
LKNALRTLAGIGLLAALALTACGGKGKEGSAPATEEKKLNLYIWTNYLPDDVAADFRKETGIDLTVDTFDSNEAVLDKLQSGVAEYDLVVPSDYAMKILAEKKLVRELELAKLSNFKNLDARFLNQQYDPANKHSIPYTWGTTGIGYNKAKVGAVDSWQALFDPKNKGRILMLDDIREAFGAALRLMGKSINETDPADLKAAAEKLKAQKALVRTYNSADFANLLAAGDVDLAQGYNGELAEVVKEHADTLAYVIPKEGGTLWIDNLAIPTQARHVEAAYAFIDFVMRPEIAARIVNGNHYASPNREAFAKIDPKITGDSSIYPPKEVLDRCELVEDVGATTQLLDQLWTEIKAQ